MRRDPTFDSGRSGSVRSDERTGVLRAGGLAFDNPVAAGGLLVMLLTSSLIIANAVSFQPGPHPAPLFFSGAPPTPAAPVASDLVREIQTALRRSGFYSGVPDGMDGPRTEDAIRAYERSAGLAETGRSRHALLAHLTLHASAPVPPMPPASTGAVPSTAPAAEGPARATVRAVQQVLADLGYGPLTVDGLLGSETAGAVRRFELDRGMAIDGRLDEPLFAVLEKVSGANIPR